MSKTTCTRSDNQFEVRFESLFIPGRALTFPCDDHGQVNLDALPPRAKNNYFFARAMVGKDFSPPALCCHR
ncbi:MAG TPA: hypothetical protein VGM81_13630 [Burkholderiaceae bacterium]